MDCVSQQRDHYSCWTILTIPTEIIVEIVKLLDYVAVLRVRKASVV